MKLHVAALVLPVLLPLLAAQAPTAAAARASGFLHRTLHDDRGEHRYVVFVPPQYDATHSWPLIVFLNGAGECGTDGWSQVSVGLGPAIMAHIERWPFLVVFPQKPDRASQWEDHDAMVMAMLESVQKDYRVDDRRLFLTGLSQGGHGTWMLGAEHRDRWNAIAPVCGYADAAAIAGGLTAMPIWCFHGEDDKAVSVQQSKDITAAITAKGGTPRLSLYPGVGHDSWVRAYRDEPLAAWLLVARKEPVLAHYLTDPSAIGSARIEAAIDGGEKDETTIVLTGDAATWSRTRAAGQHGELRGADARRFVLARLADLAVRAGFAAERTPSPRAGAWRIAVELDGSHGSWSYRHDAAGEEDAAAVRELLRAVDALAR